VLLQFSSIHKYSLTTALMEWNALQSILTLGVWLALCLSQCPVEYN